MLKFFFFLPNPKNKLSHCTNGERIFFFFAVVGNRWHQVSYLAELLPFVMSQNRKNRFRRFIKNERIDFVWALLRSNWFHKIQKRITSLKQQRTPCFFVCLQIWNSDNWIDLIQFRCVRSYKLNSTQLDLTVKWRKTNTIFDTNCVPITFVWEMLKFCFYQTQKIDCCIVRIANAFFFFVVVGSRRHQVSYLAELLPFAMSQNRRNRFRRFIKNERTDFLGIVTQ